MTEQELRQRVVSLATGWLGIKGGTPGHHTIVDIYNSHQPHARGYALKYTDYWCCGFGSAVAISAGLTDIIPPEVGCEEQIKLFQGMGRWVENDAYIPQPGDYIYYDWQDDGRGDNTGHADHVGIVVSCDGKTIKVVEGNKGNAVGYRTIPVNGRYIRGYGVPDYASKADKPTAPSGPAPEAWYADAQAWAVSMGIVKGTDNGLQPEAPCTRAEVWEMLKRYHEAATAARGGN